MYTPTVTSCIDVFTADLIDAGVDAAAAFQSGVMQQTNDLNRDETASYVDAVDTTFELTKASIKKDATEGATVKQFGDETTGRKLNQ